MAGTELVGRCGLYCGACHIYRAERDDQAWRRRMADHFKCRADQVRCGGCRALTEECWGNGCKIVNCLREKGYDSCHDCPQLEAGCEIFDRLSAGYLEDGVDLRKNLSEMFAEGCAAWSERAARKYTCGSCGGPLAAGQDKCQHCGKPVGA